MIEGVAHLTAGSAVLARAVLARCWRTLSTPARAFMPAATLGIFLRLVSREMHVGSLRFVLSSSLPLEPLTGN